MTHRMKHRRWQENPEHRVGQVQLNRVAEAAKTDKVRADSRTQATEREAYPSAPVRP